MPNPNKGEFKVILKQELKNVNIQILDFNGKLVWDKYYNSLIAESISANLTSGMYFIRLATESGEWMCKLMIE